ncbi:hypothetical protein GN244_ATG10342 [Phytophthora infestans]|uniref:PDZ domain-containing protein n=1 Tax=Phytophthora infestans TaxID=4787 RepID=A0A833WCU7_PHYIN|nr:hypothetical protein GN244_ATG10342 [Phytophthora infestans]
MSQPRVSSPGSWSSTHDAFRCLRFFVWTGGDPGFTLTTSTESDYCADALALDEDAELRVESVKTSRVWEAGIRPGDVLETVSGKRVHTMDTEAAIVLVQMSKTPSILRFRSSTHSKRVRFDVLLGRQKLGVFFTGDGSHDVPVVTRVGRQDIQTFNSDSSSSSGIRLGDILVAVNGKDAVASGLSMTTKYLATCPRPSNRQRGIRERPGRSFSLRRAIPSMTMPVVTREAASFRCKEFLRSLMPSGAHHSTYRSHETACRDVLIEWKFGPLGLTLFEDAISGAPIVNRLTGKGSSPKIERLEHGFLLYSINGVRTGSRPLDELYRYLLALPKPVLLVFRPPGSHDEDGSEHSSCSSPLSTADISFNVESGLNDQTLDKPPHRCPQQQYEYEVVWTTSQLGLQLEILHPSAKDKSSTRYYPIVHQVLKESTLGLPNDAVGHLFVSVNNWSTSGLSTTELRTLLRVAAKPAVLRFRRQEGSYRAFMSSSSYDTYVEDVGTKCESAYSILWCEGKLGLVFGCYEDADRQNTLVVYVKHIGSGQAQKSKLVAVGDILRSINGQDLPPKQKFKKTMRSLLKTKQPVTLGFRRLLVERSSDYM